MLGRGDQSASEGMYEVLVEVMRRADIGINVGYAIVYEAVTTVTTIYPNSLLLDAAATSISRFIRSDSHNLKYIGNYQKRIIMYLFFILFINRFYYDLLFLS